MTGTGLRHWTSLVPAALLAAVLHAGQAAAQDVSSPTCDELLEQGCRRLSGREFAAAIEPLSAALARQPDRGEIVRNLAQAYCGTGQRDQARKLLENFLARRPAEWDVRLDLAQLYLEGPDPAGTISVLAPFEAELDARGARLLADAYRASNRTDDAALALERALRRFPADESLRLAHIDLALDQRRHEEALRRVRAAEAQLGSRPALHLRAARAYFELGRFLGEVQRRPLPDRQAGQFQGGLLLIPDGEHQDQFLCCPPDSAMFQIRRALDAGLDDPAVHVLHARIWERCGRPEVGLAILQGRAQTLIESKDQAAIRALADLALAAGRLPDYLRYERELARCCPGRGEEILWRAFVTAAERYNQRGEEAVYAALLRRALELRPGDAELRLRVADADWDAGRTAAAAQNYRAVLEQEREHPQRARILRRLHEAGGP